MSCIRLPCASSRSAVVLSSRASCSRVLLSRRSLGQPCRAEPQNAEKPSQEVASTSGDGDVLSREEIAKLAALKRSQAAAKKQGVVQGALEEAGLIEWPTPQKAVTDTALVIAIVATMSVALFGLNSFLVELSRAIYS